MLARRNARFDLAALQREVEHRVTVWQAPSTGLMTTPITSNGCRPRKSGIDWQFWDRYRRYLEDVKLLPRQVVRRLDETTDRVLGKLENPNRDGHVATLRPRRRTSPVRQDGQLYRPSLQGGRRRLQADRDSRWNRQRAAQPDPASGGRGVRRVRHPVPAAIRPGATSTSASAHCAGAPRLKAASLTTSAEKGDFGRAVAKNMNIPVGDYPVVLVIKKHTTHPGLRPEVDRRGRRRAHAGRDEQEARPRDAGARDRRRGG